MAYMPAVLLTAGIAVLSLWENPQVPPTVQMSDKLAHGLMYTVLAVAWMIPIAIRQATNRKSLIVYVLYVCFAVTAYGALMEILQRFCTLTRSGEMADLYADFIGAAVGVTAVVLVQQLKAYKTNNSSKQSD